ncbi:MAG TPA: hypothetical protein VFD75_10715 [Pyrinomonadaceae bacterium]|nr:hypothetical protein [Pyrinomonadaceae bacterium]
MSYKLPVVMALTVFLAAADSVVGQKQSKPWKEWSKTDAQKVLNDSPWAHLQVDQDFVEPTPLTRPPDPSIDTRLKQNDGMTYGIRFFSARPVRQAFVRMIQLQKKDLTPEVMTRLNTFAEVASEDSIIIAVTIENPDANMLGKAMQIVRNATTPAIQNTTYLERSDGKRVFIEQYTPPGGDGFGARFIFPRMLDGKPFLSSDFTMVRFVSDLGNSIKMNMTYKVKDMMLDGKLEF